MSGTMDRVIICSKVSSSNGAMLCTMQFLRCYALSQCADDCFKHKETHLHFSLAVGGSEEN